MITRHQRCEPFFLLTACIFLLLITGLAACAEPLPAPTPTVPTPSTPSDNTPQGPAPTPLPEKAADVWSPDGIVTTGEYLGKVEYGDYEIRWSSDEQYIYVGIRAETSGWVAVAVQPGSRMKNADMVFGFVKDGETIVYDLFSTGDFGPHPPDIELGGTDDIVEFGGSEDEGFTILEFKRALNTSDRYDTPLSPGINRIIWAYGLSDGLTSKHFARGYGEINLGP